MDLNFNKVTYDGDLADLSEDEKESVIREYEKAQESNVAEFEKAANTLDGVDSADIEDFAEAREALIGDITEAEAFDEVPLTEEKLAEESFSDLREWQDFVEAQADEPDEGDEDDDKTFEEMGQQAPTHDGEEGDDVPDFIQREVAGMSGVSMDD